MSRCFWCFGEANDVDFYYSIPPGEFIDPRIRTTFCCHEHRILWMKEYHKTQPMNCFGCFKDSSFPVYTQQGNLISVCRQCTQGRLVSLCR